MIVDGERVPVLFMVMLRDIASRCESQ